jgi:exodeoxyribonuclease VII large subunit
LQFVLWCSIERETDKSLKQNSKPLNSTNQASDNRPGANAPEFSVSELSGAIKRALEDGFGYVRLRGEISGYRGPHSSGHCYFALKDDKAKIDAVIWKGAFGRLRFKPEEGMEVVVQGRITTFPGSSKYQIVIEALDPAGAGALMALLDERKRKFAAEGLFEEARKKPRPFLPKVVGIITSPTGAVIRDMLAGFHERFPTCVLLWPVRVQGEGSAAEVAAAIRGFNALQADGKIPRPDVLIVARGGGSLEDLWSFNEEIVVRAAAESHIPLISAVGHETDWTLLDLVADARAPTPTKAAEWAVPKYSELIETLDKLQLRKRTAVRRLLESVRTHLKAASRGLPTLDDLVAMPRQRFDAIDRRLSRALLANARAHATKLARISGRLSTAPLAQRLARLRERLVAVERRAGQALLNRVAVRRRVLDGKSALLNSLGYQSVLSRGFALVRDEAGLMVRHARSVAAGAALSVEFSDGRVGVVADGGGTAEPGEAATGGGSKTPRPKESRRGGQGSLF